MLEAMLKIRRNLILFKANSLFVYMRPLSASAIVYLQHMARSYPGAATAHFLFYI